MCANSCKDCVNRYGYPYQPDIKSTCKEFPREVYFDYVLGRSIPKDGGSFYEGCSVHNSDGSCTLFKSMEEVKEACKGCIHYKHFYFGDECLFHHKDVYDIKNCKDKKVKAPIKIKLPLKDILKKLFLLKAFTNKKK